jgi:hypothetical protein
VSIKDTENTRLCSRHVSGINLISNAQSQTIAKPNNLKFIGSKKSKGSFNWILVFNIDHFNWILVVNIDHFNWILVVNIDHFNWILVVNIDHFNWILVVNIDHD